MKRDLGFRGRGTRLALTLSGLLLMSVNAFAGTYYIAGSGSDTNNGTSKSTPWLHAPGMPKCTGTCASHTPVAGDQFIFRGGDTWHFGSSMSPSTGGTWQWQWLGSAGNPIYIGVDQTWYSGGSWIRPILNADNALSVSPVASCSYQIGSSNILVDMMGTSYVTLDNFELTGLCQNDTGAPFAHDIYLRESGASNNLYEHLYIHGWTALSFAGCSGSSGHCFNLFAFLGSFSDGDRHFQDVIDGSDSNPSSLGVIYAGGYDVSQSVFRYVSQIVISRLHLWHDNLLEHWYEPGDGQAHGNLLESSGESSNNNAIYNNVFQHICSDSGACPLGIVGIWPQPDVGRTDYIFNNVCSDCQGLGSNYIDIGQNSGAQGTLVIFNNTFDIPSPATSSVLNCTATATFTAANNHYILEGSSPYGANCIAGTFVTELAMNHVTATAHGYTPSETFAYSPTSISNPTVGNGTNKQSFCTTISGAGLGGDAATACQSDTRYACTYNSSTHTVSCPTRAVVPRGASGAWDVGTYTYASSGGSGPTAPTGLTATVH